LTTAHILKHKETTMNDQTPPDNEPKPEPELTPFQAMLASLDLAISDIEHVNPDLRKLKRIMREVLA